MKYTINQPHIIIIIISVFTNLRAYQSNLTKYADEMNAVDSLRDTLQMVSCN